MKKLTVALFGIYLIALIWILLFKLGVQFSYMERREVNLIPFSALLLEGPIDLPEIILNIVIFVPLGVYTRILFEHWGFGRSVLFFMGITLIVEGLQFILKVGAFDSTDLATNTAGGVVGLMIIKLTEKLFGSRYSAHKFLTITAAIGTGVVVVFLILLKTNSLWIRYQ